MQKCKPQVILRLRCRSHIASYPLGFSSQLSKSYGQLRFRGREKQIPSLGGSGGKATSAKGHADGRDRVPIFESEPPRGFKDE